MFEEMPHKLSTRQMRVSLIMLAALGYILAPILFAALMFTLLDVGAFPPNADSIGIPIAGFTLLWLLFSPIFILACYLFEKVGQWIAMNFSVNLREQHESVSVK